MFLFLGLLLILVLWYLYAYRRPSRFPPGPPSVPLFGALPFLGLNSPQTLFTLRPKYGPVIGFDFGGTRCVAISDLKLIKEVANDAAFSARPNLLFMSMRSGGEAEGIIFTTGRKWQEQKRFTLRKLRDFGFGTRSMETIVHDEVQELIERFKKDVGKPISTTNSFNVAVLNALWTIVTGERFRQDDPTVNEIIKLVNQDFNSVATHPGLMVMMFLAMFTPWIGKYCPDWLSGLTKIMGQAERTTAIIKPTIEAHFASHIEGQPRDFLDAYIDEVKGTTDPESSFHMSKRNTFVFTIFDLFMAGTETTSTTLSWIFLYMSRHPHVQEKLADEIHRVVGNSRLPNLADRANMPYTEAVIHEVMRMRTLAPIPMQSPFEDTEFNGFLIPKGTLVILNLWAALNDPAIWGDPENFRPERFLTKDETKFVHHEAFIPFSTGKRGCLGERLARDELFLFTTALFQVFEVDWDRQGQPPSLTGTPGGLVLPYPHKLVLKLRA